MLVSRVIFQRRGPAGMRECLDRWKVSAIRRLWGLTSLAGVAVVLIAFDAGDLRWTDWVMLMLLVAILGADGLVNVLPTGSATFEDTVQTAWVRRHDGPRSGDRDLFGTVNAVLDRETVSR
jgi:hypothetical protein